MSDVTTSVQVDLKEAFRGLKQAYSRNPSPSLDQRKAQLKSLKASLLRHEQTLYEAMKQDYGYRSEFDTLLADIMPTVAGINYALKNVKKWMKPSKRHSGLLLAPSTVTVHYQPLGVVGVITPWNFPIYLALGPTVQALAAGNKVMIKLSEFTPNTNKALIKVVECISEDVLLIEGEADVGAAFSSLPFDHLLFTGSTAVGKVVAKAAADNLTPLTLELGGKSPTIIDQHINMDIVVDALIVGKSINSGQICVAPDYVFVPQTRQQELINTFIARYKTYYVDSKNSNTQSHIISDKQHQRLLRLLNDVSEKGGKTHPIEANKTEHGRRVYPHLVTQVSQDMDVLKQEIFGSILPIMTYQKIEEVIEYINQRERPLALYVMSKDRTLIDRILTQTHSGGVCINDTLMHVAADDAPFGGIGHSGIGHYHGYEGFLTFSKAKTVLHSSAWLPKNQFILKHRDFVFNTIRRFLLK
ncbi:coniferyl aldehyde dehydrogenase [Thalassotalea aquiviva]|uniref:coniferyl aldehyde dehydrogenase n=1 Tax=Thalassotalea aquiviva TaxID=3242415 RepID=UPI00352A614B